MESHLVKFSMIPTQGHLYLTWYARNTELLPLGREHGCAGRTWAGFQPHLSLWVGILVQWTIYIAVQQPDLTYPKCQWTWNNTCYVFPPFHLVHVCSVLCFQNWPFSQGLLMAKIMINVLKLIPQIILWVRYYYHPRLPGGKTKEIKTRFENLLSHSPKVT